MYSLWIQPLNSRKYLEVNANLGYDFDDCYDVGEFMLCIGLIEAYMVIPFIPET
jgi:hypothetical protein